MPCRAPRPSEDLHSSRGPIVAPTPPQSSWIGVLRGECPGTSEQRTMSDPLIFHEFEWLRQRVVDIDRRRIGPGADTGPPVALETERFLIRESKLESI